jgi:hypothetical protein
VRGGQIASAGIAFAALLAGVGLLVGWLASENSPVESTPQARATPAAPSLATEVRSPGAASEHLPGARIQAEPEEPTSPPPAKSPACQDLDAILSELCELLQQPQGAFPFHVEPRLEVWSQDLDQHCVSILESRIGAPRPSVERLAALSLLREASPALEVARLSASEGVLLWNLFDVTQPADVLKSGIVGEQERREHREGVARLAAKCLAALGGEQDLARLTAMLDGNGPEMMLALCAFDEVRSASTTNALLTRLADPTQRMGMAGQAMESLLNQPGIELDPQLRERAACGLAERWRANGVEGHELERVSRILGKLDPALLAERWGELADQGAVASHTRLAAGAWAANSSPADLAHLDGWLGADAAAEQLSAARAVLLHAREDVPIADLKRKAAAALDELARNCPDPGIRREALFSAKAAPDVIASIASRALYDENATVREAAVLAAQHLVVQDASLRARFERAAASDPDERVRRAAAHALR